MSRWSRVTNVPGPCSGTPRTAPHRPRRRVTGDRRCGHAPVRAPAGRWLSPGVGRAARPSEGGSRAPLRGPLRRVAGGRVALPGRLPAVRAGRRDLGVPVSSGTWRTTRYSASTAPSRARSWWTARNSAGNVPKPTTPASIIVSRRARRPAASTPTASSRLIVATGGASVNAAPASVATPLPPCRRPNQGQRAPTTAPSPRPSRPPTTTSRSRPPRGGRPSRGPPSTRGASQPGPDSRPASRAVGIEPTRYPPSNATATRTASRAAAAPSITRGSSRPAAPPRDRPRGRGPARRPPPTRRRAAAPSPGGGRASPR